MKTKCEKKRNEACYLAVKMCPSDDPEDPTSVEL